MQTGKFPCTSCGACCRRAHLVPDFPEPVKEDGSCTHLKKGNTCAIYETRPLICRVDDMYEQFFKEKVSKEDFYEANLATCRMLQKEDGV